MTLTAWGEEFLVNTSGVFDQNDSDVVQLTGGRFVMIWSSDLIFNANQVNFRVFDADGTPIGSQQSLPNFAGFEIFPDITALSSGNFVISWAGSTSASGVYSHVFDPDGDPIGSVVQITNPTVGSSIHSITSLGNGNYIAGWADLSGVPVTRFQEFNASGARVGSGYTAPSASAPELTTVPNSNSFIDASIISVADAGGVVRAHVNVKKYTSGTPVVLFDEAPPSGFYEGEVSSAILPGGNIVLAWIETVDPIANEFNLALRILNSSGALISSSNFISSKHVQQPDLAAMPNGGFALSWAEAPATGIDAGFFDVYLATFSSSGSAIDAAARVNSTTVGQQTDPAVTSLADGRLLVSWTDSSQTGADTDGGAVRSQIMDPRVTPLTINGTGQSDSYYGTSFNDLLFGNGGADTLWGDNGNDVLDGGIGNDTLVGGAGNDVLDGRAGADIMNGGAGNETYYWDNVADQIIEVAGGGTDQIRSFISLDLGASAGLQQVERGYVYGQANATIFGNNLANVLAGNDGIGGVGGNNRLEGRGGADIINGGGGNDFIIGGTERDVMTGGTGRDGFRFYTIAEAGNGAGVRDIITDFATSTETGSTLTSDYIDLSLIDANLTNATHTFAFIGTGTAFTAAGQLRARIEGGNTIIEGNVNANLAADFQIQLNGLKTLVAGDFIL